jgi:DNA-binding GntR family transcriptional regulator
MDSNAKEQTYQDLKRRIVQEQFLPGQWVVEREICAQYGLSRTPIREILRSLVSDGFLELRPAKGYLIRRLSLEEIVAIFQAREAVEGMAAGLAARNFPQGGLARLRMLRDQLGSLDTRKDASEGVRLGSKLHDLIVERAGNFLLLQFYQKLKNLAALTRNLTRKSAAIEAKSREDHLAVIGALEEGSEERSEQRLREHLRSTCDLLLESYRERYYP